MKDESALNTYNFVKSYVYYKKVLKAHPSEILKLTRSEFNLNVAKLATRAHAHLEVPDLKYYTNDFKKLYQQAHYAKICAVDDVKTYDKRKEYINEGLSGSFAELDFPYNSYNRPKDKALNVNFYTKFFNICKE